MWKKIITLLPVIIMSVNLNAQSNADLKGLYGSMNLGCGLMNANITSEDMSTSVRFSMQVSVGYFISKSLQAGITASGWLFEPYWPILSDENGESISNTMIHLQVYPLKQFRLYTKVGYGISRYINKHPLKDYGRGHVLMSAIGFEKKAGRKEVLWGIQIAYHAGDIRLGDLNATGQLLNRKFNVADLTLFFGLD
jgi:hypothetical protein